MDMTDGIELELRDAAKTRKLDLPPKERDAYAAFAVRLLKAATSYGPLDRVRHSVEWFNDDENFAEAMQQVLYLQKAINAEGPRLHEKLDKPELVFGDRQASAQAHPPDPSVKMPSAPSTCISHGSSRMCLAGGQ